MAFDSNYYNENNKNIIGIDFGILSDRELKKYSAIKDPLGINSFGAYKEYKPEKGGLMDSRMGTSDHYIPCTTCGLNVMDCPGHFGHINLAEPVFHFGFFNYLKVVLQCVCHNCAQLLINKESDDYKKLLSKSNKTKFNFIKEKSKNVTKCFNCNTPVPKVKKEENKTTAAIRIIAEKVISEKNEEGEEVSKTIKEFYNPRDCYNILVNISDEDATLLGFPVKNFRPENLIQNLFPVPPVCIRPTNKVDFYNSVTMEDALTVKAAEIVRANKRVQEKMDKAKSGSDLNIFDDDVFTLLQYHCAIFVNNDSASLPKSTYKTGNRQTKSISDRINGKQGRVRLNCMAKRVDNSARTVITSDPYIDIDEVGVPIRLARILTIPEEVTELNIKRLTKLVRNGYNNYPGANFVYKHRSVLGKQQASKIDLKYRKTNLKLQKGDIVLRHIVDGDYVLFNRQPTLHKPSMMGHRVQVINDENANSFRMSVSICEPYNADFDGDEMNIFVAQSIQAKNELARITNAKYQIIHAKNSNPIIGCVQDTLIGAYMLSKDDVKIERSDALNMLANTSVIDKIIIPKDKKYLTGKEVFSYLIPKGIFSSKGSFEVKDGEFISGNLNKSQLSSKKNSLIHYIWDKYGATYSKNFIDDCQRLVLNYLMYLGQTIGFGDAIINDKLMDKANKIAEAKVLEVKHQLTDYETSKDKISLEVFEDSISSILNSIGSDLGNMLFKSLDTKDNNYRNIIDSGAKGKPENVRKAFGLFGQINIGGGRIKRKINNRPTIYSYQGDDTPEARGFIKSSYLEGLDSTAFFFDAMAGRDGLISTAVGTATTGYIQRKLIKGLEDCMVKYDSTVRNSNNIMLEYVYGGNGINQLTQTSLKVPLFNMGDKDIEKEYCLDKTTMTKLKLKSNTNKEIKQKMIDFRNNLRKYYFNAMLSQSTGTDTFMLPVNLNRITLEYYMDSKKYDIKPQYIYDKIEDILNDAEHQLIIYKGDIFRKDERTIKYFYEISLHHYLSPKNVIEKYRLTKDKFDELCETIKLAYTKSLVEPGEMVGNIAAQSIGEPTTQLSLDTKHSAGGVKSKALSGVGRIKEILSNNKDIKTPLTNVYFNNDIHYNKDKIRQVSGYFRHLTIDQLISSAEIVLDNNGFDDISKKIREDKTTIPFFINNEKAELESLPFVFRIKLDLEKMLDKNITILDLKTRFISYWYKNFSNNNNLKKRNKEVISSVTKLAILANTLDTIHIRFSLNQFDYNLLVDFLDIVLNKITIKGIDMIDDIYVEEKLYMDLDDDNKFVSKKEFVMQTEGINIPKLLTFKTINHTRTYINDVRKTLKYYGIEAARNVIYKELKDLFDGGSINHNHFDLLVDFMTHTGNITSIDRHGLRKLDNGPLSKASFESTMDVFFSAAFHNEKDNMEAVSSRVMMGKVISGGTGSFDLLIDIDKIENTELMENESKNEEFIPIKEDIFISDFMTNDLEEVDIFVP